jgi:glycosyltransferase involved in cell wall biosynthesis
MSLSTTQASIGLDISGTLIDRRRHAGVGGFTTSDARVAEHIFHSLLFQDTEDARLELFGTSPLIATPEEAVRMRERCIPFHRLPTVPDVFLIRSLFSCWAQNFLRDRICAGRAASRSLALMHYTSAAGTWGHRPLARQELVTICDLYPERMDPAALQARRQRVAERRETLWVMAISNFTARDVVKLLDLPAERVVSIPLAVDHDVYRPEPAEADARMRLQEKFPEGFALFVGSFSKRKNFLALAEAIEALNQRRSVPLPLVMAGPELGAPLRERRAIRAHLRGLFQRTPFTEILRPTNPEIAALYRHARVLVHPAIFEGFGLTVMEALASGCPVVCGRHSSLTEVGGPAAEFVEDVRDVEELGAAIERILDADAGTAARRRQAGVDHSAGFTWTRFEQETAALHRRILGLPAGRPD